MFGESTESSTDSSPDETASFSGTGDELLSDVRLLVLSAMTLELCVVMILWRSSESCSTKPFVATL